jgi:acid phosphatase
LKNNIGPLLADSNFKQHGLLIVTWDESDGDSTNGGGRVAWVVVGAKVKRGYQGTGFYHHESTLKLMMQALGLTTFPNAAANAPSMNEFFSSDLP